MSNPLLASVFLPLFSSIRPKHVIPALKFALEYCQNTVNQVIMQPPGLFTWENLCQPLAESDNYLNRIWSSVSHLNSVNSSQEFRVAYQQGLLLLSDYRTWVMHHDGLYRSYQDLYSSHIYAKLSVSKKKVVENVLRDFELSGIKLSSEKRKRYGQIISRLSELSSIYSNNVLDSTTGWSKRVTDKKVLLGIPERTLAAVYVQEQYDTSYQEFWLLTLDTPIYLSVLTYCDNEVLRREIYDAYNTRASDKGPNAGKWDNGPIINEILTLRYKLAKLLGFKSYADISLATKMAKDPDQVLSFLNDLVKRVLIQSKMELEQLRIFTQSYFDRDTLEPWNIAYYSEKQKKCLFSINEEQLSSYFPESCVISGLFEVIHRIYGIIAKERTNVEVWHKDVRFFDFFNEHGELQGSIYFDLYAREKKRDGAWMDECVGMMRTINGELQHPVAYINCNFNRPVNGKSALFTYSEVTTLFHELGHGLHHILTRIDTFGVSGISGVPWDAVEFPSQFMENYCQQSAVISLISCHHETGEILSGSLLKQLLKSKKYQVSLSLLRQLELGIFDLRIHQEYRPTREACVLEILREVKNQVEIVPAIVGERFYCTFSHVFSGGYSAGYYSYLWANILASDAWTRFEKEGIFNRETGKSFLSTVLSCGGSEDPLIIFMRFMGREPKIDAMLTYYGIK